MNMSLVNTVLPTPPTNISSTQPVLSNSDELQSEQLVTEADDFSKNLEADTEATLTTDKPSPKSRHILNSMIKKSRASESETILSEALGKDYEATAHIPVLALLTDRLEQVTPENIPELITKNPFIQEAIANPSGATFHQEQTIAEIANMLELSPKMLTQAMNQGISLDEKTTPTQFLKSIGIDPQKVLRGLSRLRHKLTKDGIPHYVARAKAVQSQAVTPAKKNTKSNHHIDEKTEHPLQTQQKLDNIATVQEPNLQDASTTPHQNTAEYQEDPSREKSKPTQDSQPIKLTQPIDTQHKNPISAPTSITAQPVQAESSQQSMLRAAGILRRNDPKLQKTSDLLKKSPQASLNTDQTDGLAKSIQDSTIPTLDDLLTKPSQKSMTFHLENNNPGQKSTGLPLIPNSQMNLQNQNAFTLKKSNPLQTTQFSVTQPEILSSIATQNMSATHQTTVQSNPLSRFKPTVTTASIESDSEALPEDLKTQDLSTPSLTKIISNAPVEKKIDLAKSFEVKNFEQDLDETTQQEKSIEETEDPAQQQETDTVEGESVSSSFFETSKTTTPIESSSFNMPPVEKAAQKVLEKSQMLVEEGGGTVFIDLQEELGQADGVGLSIQLNGDDVKIKLVSNSEELKEKISAGLPALQSQLNDHQLKLVSVDLGTESDTQHQQDENPDTPDYNPNPQDPQSQHQQDANIQWENITENIRPIQIKNIGQNIMQNIENRYMPRTSTIQVHT